MASVLISTWGDPRWWENVTYVMDGQRYPVRTKSSLPVILKWANPKPEKVFLIVLDTVIKKPVSSFNDLRDSVMAYYLEFLHSLDLDPQIPVEVIVAPGVGRFRLDDGSYAEFHGFLTDYLAYVTFEISRCLLQTADNWLTVHLDLTHGINFMPSLTYAAVCEVLGALAIAKKVYLKAYNSEPYIKGVTTELNIHKVEDREFRPNLIGEGLPNRQPTKESNLLEPAVVDEKERVAVQNRLYGIKLVEDLNVFLSSLVNGLPLAFYAFYPDVDSLERTLQNAVRLWFSETKVSVADSKMLVNRVAKFRSEFTKCAIIWTVAKSLRYVRKYEVSLGELKDLQQKVFSKWTKLGSMISYDLDNIRRKVENYKGPIDIWKKLSDIAEDRYSVPIGNRLARNFLAHSGLESTLIYVRRKGDRIVLRYGLDKNEERNAIIKACYKGLHRS